MADKEKQAILKAIGELGRRVTPADVATKTGLPVLVVQQKLNQVAMETNGNLQVGKTGDIVYSFAPGFTNSYLAKGLSAVALVVGAKLMETMYYLVRISFGIALIVSLILVVVLLIAMAVIMSRGLGGGNNRDDGDFFSGWSGEGFHFSFWDWMVLRDLFMWNAYYNPTPIRYDYRAPTVRKRSRSNFLLNCFSFLFGDGDPNEGLAEKRWQVIAQVIKKNGNAVTAEQLAPYTGADPKDENAVLPTLVRFNGKPEVTPSGHIVYVFESMQSIAADQRANPPDYLEEFPWKFTNVADGDLVPVYIVAGLNFAGAWKLWDWVRRVPSLSHGPLMTLVLVLCSYGSLFAAVPAVRWLINKLRNERIVARNKERYKHSRLLVHPETDLQKKLAECADYRLGARKLSSADVVFTTEDDSRDQADELSEKCTKLEEQQ
jgi:hypothetical protein